MKNRKNRKLKHPLLVASTCLLVFPALAGNWYADASKAPNSGDGLTPATAFHTIQEAVSHAVADDTVYVAPGVYDDGTQPGSSWTYGGVTADQATRLVVDKKLTIRASDPTNKPVILGSHGDAAHVSEQWKGTPQNIFYRTTSIVCVLVQTAAAGSVFRDLVFRDGNAHQSASSNAEAAGGIYFQSPRANAADFTVIDCEFDHCCGRGAGAVHGGSAIRCTFRRNFTAGLASASYQTKAYNCLFRDNATVESGQGNMQAAVDCVLVNCTLVNNGMAFGVKTTGNTSGYGVYVNTVVYGNAGAGGGTGDPNGQPTACVADESIGGAPIISASDATVMTNVCVCPALDDVRPVKGGLLDGKGDGTAAASALDFVPSDEIAKAFDGTPLQPSDAWHIGIRMTATEVKSGAFLVWTRNLSVDGKDLVTTPAYIQSAEWPRGLIFGKSSTSTSKFLYVNFNGVMSSYRGIRDSVWQLLPPKAEADGKPTDIVAVDIGTYDSEIYVDGDYVGEVSNGEKLTPYKTIQDAVKTLVTETKFTLVHVAGGHYNKGTPVTDSTGHRARVYVPAGKWVAFIADDGPENTFIEGEPGSDAGGCGEDAARCVCVNADCCVFAGFSFVNGHTKSLSTGNDSDRGGAVWASSTGHQFLDCRFSANSGQIAAACKGWYSRCVFTNNVDHLRGVITGAILESCLVAKNGGATPGQVYAPFMSSIVAYNCSVYEPLPARGVLAFNTDAVFVNCAMWLSDNVAASTTGGNLIRNVYRAGVDLVEQVPNMHEDPSFACMTHRNYKLSPVSSAIGYGRAIDPDGRIKSMSMIKYINLDIEGNVPLRADGTLNAGCYAILHQPTPIFVSPSGNDSADGLTEGTAYRTLQKAVDVAAEYACCRTNGVIALPGTYATGARCHAGRVYSNSRFSPTLPSRVLVPGGVTLASRDGFAMTVIQGKAADAEDPSRDAHGCGDTAVRCAFLENDAVLRGFTLENGHTWTNIVDYHDDVYGGAVLGRSASRTSVEECVLTDNYSPCAGGAANVTLRRCRVEDNRGWHFGSAVANASLYDCSISGNCGEPVCYVFSDVVNSTFYGNWGTDDMSRRARLFAVANTGSRIVNVLGYDCRNVKQVGMGPASFLNCVFDSGFMLDEHNAELPFENVNTNIDNAVLAACYENGRALSCEAPTVDCGSASGSTGTLDLAGDERIKNGIIDIGAYEYGWYAEFSRAIGRRFTVVKTSGDILSDTGRAVLRDGARLVGIVGADAGTQMVCVISLNGEGALSVYLNGVPLQTFAQSGSVGFVCATAADVLTFAYVGAGTASVASLHKDSGLMLIVR